MKNIQKLLIIAIVLILSTSACTSDNVPTPDYKATVHVIVATALTATKASEPTASPAKEPTPTLKPTNTPRPTNTPTPSPTSTPISIGEDTWIIKQDTHLQLIDVEEFPLNNCNGSGPFRATETRSKTVWHEIKVEGSAYVRIPLAFQLQGAYGVKDGKAETRSYEITFEVAPHSFITYTVIWYDVWIEGEIKLLPFDDGILYKVKTGIIFKLDGGRAVACP